MFKQTITRVRPNKTVKWHFESETVETVSINMSLGAILSAAGADKDADENFSVTQTESADGLTLTVVRISSSREALDDIQAAFANPDHILYGRTQYYITNGVTETYVTEAVTA